VRVEHDDDDDDDNAAEESGDLVYISFYVELMGRRSNLILVADDGTIMDSAKRVPPAMSRVRPVLPHLPYAPPPPLDRLDPRRITAGDAGRLLASLPGETLLARALVGAYRGMSPRMAEEIAFRVGGDAVATVAAVPPDSGPALAREMAALLAPLERDTWQPRVYRERDGEGAAEVVAFSPAPMAHLAANHDEIAVESISAAAAMAEGAAARPPQERHAQRRQRLCDAIAAARERAERRLASLADAADRAEEAERLKARGELIYAHLWQIALGQSELAVDDMVIPLDPHLSASENAQAYFERYRKAQSGARQVPELAAESRAEIAYLDQLTTLVAHAPGFAELEALAAEWAEHAGQASAAGFPAKRKQPAPRRPRPLVDAAGNSVYVGHSGPQNELITFDIAGADDTWLHARGVGGSHVVIRWRTPDGAENAETVAAAAALAAWYSAARESGSVEVDVARRRHVRKLKGGGPGMVTYRNERTIRVGPASEADLSGILRER
jgi:predicted ribosome quality control (RQC) complex YloA/Tae2 family protein